MRLPVLSLVVLTLAACAPTVPRASGDEHAKEEITSFWEDGEWKPASRTVWTYGEPEAEATAALQQTWTDEAWVNASLELWEVDDQGRQESGTMAEWNDGALVPRMAMAYAYDAAGNKLSASRRTLDAAGNTSPADSLVSSFEDGGRETGRQFLRWVDGGWEEGLRQTSEYDADGRETARLHLVPGETGWTPQRRWTFTHHAAGEIATSLVEQMEDGAWTPWLDQTYSYDRAGNLTRLTHQEWSDAAWQLWMRNETLYASDS